MIATIPVRLFALFFLLSHAFVSAVIEDLASAKDLWYGLTDGLPTDYTYQYLPEGDVNAPYILSIRNDTVTDVALEFFTIGGTNSFDTQTYPTVDDLFDIIETYEMANETDGVLSVDAKYDPRYGYPTSINIQFDEDSGEEPIMLQVRNLTPYTILRKELTAMQELWESYGAASDSYSYIIQVFCFCFADYVSPKQIEVVDNAIISITDVGTGLPYTDASYDTIIDLFDLLDLSISRFDVVIDATYDAEYGSPLSVTTYPQYGLADAGYTVEVSNVALRPVPLDDPSPSNGVIDGGEDRSEYTPGEGLLAFFVSLFCDSRLADFLGC